ncbi:MAG TPA: DUF3305 domain-containing protein [Gammaproteobacteria bacterium]
MSSESITAVPDQQRLEVTLVRSVAQVGRWESIRWELGGVALSSETAPEPGQAADRVVLRGVPLRLYRDQLEDYCVNLASAEPKLFVVCNPDPDNAAPLPRLATLSQGEAMDYMETDEQVLSCPIEGPVRDWIEAWTLLAPLPVGGGKKRRNRGAAND